MIALAETVTRGPLVEIRLPSWTNLNIADGATAPLGHVYMNVCISVMREEEIQNGSLLIFNFHVSRSSLNPFQACAPESCITK